MPYCSVCFVLFQVFVWERAVLSWCPSIWLVDVVYNIFSLNISSIYKKLVSMLFWKWRSKYQKMLILPCQVVMVGINNKKLHETHLFLRYNYTSIYHTLLGFDRNYCTLYFKNTRSKAQVLCQMTPNLVCMLLAMTQSAVLKNRNSTLFRFF